MSERPILFSSRMVRAILSAQKTMTRRVAKHIVAPDGIPVGCPYGERGDRLWVRETWARGDRDGDTIYAADQVWDINGVPVPPPCNWGTRWAGCWRPSIHMPRWASRINLEITAIRVEHVQDISNNDALAEGTPDNRTIANNYELRDCFRELWDHLNEKRGYGWGVNPWVWVISFRRIP